MGSTQGVSDSSTPASRKAGTITQTLPLAKACRMPPSADASEFASLPPVTPAKRPAPGRAPAASTAKGCTEVTVPCASRLTLNARFCGG